MHALTLILIIVAWVPFRTADMDVTMRIWRAMAGAGDAVPAGLELAAPLGPMTALAVVVLLTVARVFAADITGTWKASFDTQIGQQNYTYEFVVKGTTLTGKIQSEMGGTTEILQGKVEGDKVSFVEVFKFEGNEIQITYTGQVTSNDEIKFTRQVAEFATEEIVAKRAK